MPEGGGTIDLFPRGVQDPTLYRPREEDLMLLRRFTGINDDEELKKHTLEMQKAAFAIHPYPCIRNFHFITSKIENYPFYNSILKVSEVIPRAIFLDLGCCFGNDARRLVADGWPGENIIISDIQEEYHKIALEFYKASSDADHITFVKGDLFDPDFLSPDTMPARTVSRSKPPDLKSLISLTPLQHRVSVVHLSWVFHLFSEDKQRQLACLVATLLSPASGSMIIGNQFDCPDTQENQNGGLRFSVTGRKVFAHSPTSWRKLWMRIFKEGEVRVESWLTARSKEYSTETLGGPVEGVMYEHTWSVTRL